MRPYYFFVKEGSGKVLGPYSATEVQRMVLPPDAEVSTWLPATQYDFAQLSQLEAEPSASDHILRQSPYDGTRPLAALPPPSVKARRVWGYWVAIVLLLALGGTFCGLYVESQNDADYQRGEAREQQEKARDLLAQYNHTIQTCPLIIKDIQIANIGGGDNILTYYGKNIYSSQTMYLKPRITYDGLTSRGIRLYVKWYCPDGTMSTGLSSPAGYTYYDDIYIGEGDGTLTLSGWGRAIEGNWGRGTYRIEIWYDDVCLKAKTFSIR